MDDRELGKLLAQAGQDPGAFVGTASQMNPDGTVTVTGGGGSVNAIAQTAFRSGAWSVKRVGGTWYAWSENSPIVETESTKVRRSKPTTKQKNLGAYVFLLDSNFYSFFLDAIPTQNQKFLENLLLKYFYFTPKRIYTFADNPGEGLGSKTNECNEILKFFAKKVIVEEVTVAQLSKVNSLFYWALTVNHSISGITEFTVSRLKKIAKSYGLILQGENQVIFEPFVPVNNFYMDKFYKPFHPKYDFVFEAGKNYVGGHLPYDNKKSKTLFDGVNLALELGVSGAIPIDVVPTEEILTLINDPSKSFVGAIGWGVK